MALLVSGVARNSQWSGLESRRLCPSLSTSRPSLLPSLTPFSLSVSLFVTVFLPLPSLPLIMARVWGSAIAPPAGPGGARPPYAFSCSHSPKFASLLMFDPRAQNVCATFWGFFSGMEILSVLYKFLQCVWAESGYQVH